VIARALGVKIQSARIMPLGDDRQGAGYDGEVQFGPGQKSSLRVHGAMIGVAGVVAEYCWETRCLDDIDWPSEISESD